MKSIKILSILILVAGIALLALGLLADTIGIGDKTSFGFKQIIAVAAGAVLSVAGVVLLFKK